MRYPRRADSPRRVSILVLMEVLREVVAQSDHFACPADVSILVLMEVLREERAFVFDGYRRVGFQSLF